MTARTSVLAGCLSCWLVGVATAQVPRSARPPGTAGEATRPAVGLALSGGAARGFAHVGVLEVLEDAGVPVDAVSGTSMGAVIGGLYASGLSVEAIRAVAADVDWERLFDDAPERRNLPVERKVEEGRTVVSLPVRGWLPRLPTGIIEGQRITLLLTGLTWHVHPVRDFRDLPIPFVAVATDAGTGDAVVLAEGFLPEAMRASLAIPTVFAPVEIDGRFLVDGGIARNLPAPDVAALGADIVICSDVTKPLQPADSLRSLVDILTQTIAYRTVERRDEDVERCDVLIAPDIRGIESGDFARAREIIERGREAAEAALDTLEALGLLDARLRGAAFESGVRRETVPVRELRISGLERTRESTVRNSLELEVPDTIPRSEIDEAVARLYDTGLFERVSYRLDLPERAGTDPADPDGRILDVIVRDESRDYLGLGYRYEGEYKASILATAAVRNALLLGSTLLADLRIGEQTRAAARLEKRSGWGVAPLLTLGAEYRRSPFDLYEEGERVTEPRVKDAFADAFLGLGFGYAGALGVRLKVEGTEADEAAQVDDWSADRQSFFSLSGVLRWDSWDRAIFPRGGVAILGRSEWTLGALGGAGDDFSHHVLDVDGAIPVSSRVTLRARGTVGTTDGPDLPASYQFFLGGANRYYLYPGRHFPLAGLRVQERRGRHLQRLGLGLQWEVLPELYALARFDAAALPEEWRLDADDWFTGFGVGAGAHTRFGSVKLMLTGGEAADAARLELDVGFPF